MKNIAIIGSGLTGLTAARQLKSFAHTTVFDKSKGVGGRLATRYTDKFEFDHGAQYFIAKSQEFKSLVDELLSAGVIAPWNARFVVFDGNKRIQASNWNDCFAHYIGIPRMNMLAKYLAKDLNLLLACKIVKVEFMHKQWWLWDEANVKHGPYDWVISTAPYPQTLELFSSYIKMLPLKMQACYALMLGYEDDLNLDWDAALIKNSCLSFLSVNSHKLNRMKKGVSLVALSDNNWADAHVDDEILSVKDMMIETLKSYVDRPYSYVDIHRWRYANTPQQDKPKIFFDINNQLIAGGDWSISGRVESAFLAGLDIANKFISYLKDA